MATNIERISKGNNPVNAIISFVQNNRRKIIRPLVALAVILLIWQILCHDPNSTLPGPLKMISESGNLIVNPFFDNGGTDKGLFWQLLASLQRVAIGFTLAAILGISLGILIGTNSLMFDALDPIFQVLRTIPPLAWLPISLGAFQQFNPFEGMGITTSEVSALFVILVTAIWPIIINTTVGVQQIPQDYRNVARVLRLPRQKYFWKILLPSAVPYIFTGLRIGIGLSWLAIVAAEMLVGGVGIGFFIWDSYNSSRLSHVILAVIYVGIVGLLLDRLVGFIASKVVPEEQK
ncbi:nitrate ABC transporter permease [Kamptonema animale CS-326]|jgi:nitrate/nitrite transport system permease protein|uniref:nitrate ABC transporter permease n=1 Tax=Kamptonema animale TaxID=92934 RepID=UPI00232D100F|nr:nitrate ABC transporter permease [Kamptonema animale]MDB9513253.1 nitrate ABC transporter permease [Kamptonema animale CS-326]